MYSILIVDDEKPARELIKMKIDLDSLGFNIIDEARDGQEALELYKEKYHDIIVTDIEMPVMGGLEFIQNIRDINNEQSIIILSCHENFLFAKKAIKLGVEDYLIKDSFDVEEIYTLISRILKTDITINDSDDIKIKEDEDNHKDIAIKTLIYEGVNKDILPEYLQKYHLNLNSEYYVLMYIEIGSKEMTLSGIKGLDKIEIRTILSRCRAVLKTVGKGELCYDENNGFICVYGVKSNISKMNYLKDINSAANRLRTAVHQSMDKSMTIGVSSSFNNIDDIKLHYDEAKEVVQNKIFMGYDRTFFYNETKKLDGDYIVPILNMKLKKIKEYLSQGNFEPIYGEIRDIFLQKLKGFMQYNYLKYTNWELINILFEYCSGIDKSFGQICEIEGSPFEKLMLKNTVDEMCSWFIEQVNKIEDKLKSKDDQIYSYYVSKCINYINKNYDKNISLSNLADEYGINSAYLARIFKKESGKSISDYTTTIRIEHAKDLILTTDKKLYEISDLTGFGSTQRFYLLFKKVVGVSPGEFRKSK